MSEPDTTKQEKSWQHNHSADQHHHHDPLLACLMLFTKIHQRVVSQHSLIAGLPLVDNHLTPALLIRAAERANLAAKIIKRPLAKITNSSMPMILLLKDKHACVLLDVSHIKRAHIIEPETGVGVNYIPMEELEQNYTGYAIYIRPAYQFTDRSKEAGPTSKGHWFWNVLKTVWPVYGEVLIASFLINVFALAVPLYIMNVYDRVVPNHAIETLWVLSIGIGIVFIFDFLMRSLRSYFIDIAGKNVDIRLSATIFEQVMGVKMANRPSSVGAFANTVTSFESFRDFITSSTITVLVDLPFVFLYMAIIGIVGGTLILVPLIIIPLVILFGWLIQIPLTELTKESYKYSAEKQATLIEALSSAETIKSINAEGPIQRRWEHIISLASRLGIKLRFFANLGINFSILAQQLASVILVIFGVYKITQGDITTGALIACTILVSRAIAPISQLAALLTRYYQSKNSLLSLNKIMELPLDRPKGGTTLHRPVLNGEIEFNNVSFHYPNQPISALHHISFKITPGERVALIGRLGSGKTTIAKLLLGLYQSSEGTILLDGTEIKQIDPVELRANMGYVSQDVTLFYGSIKNNIVLGAPYVDDSAILKAAHIACVDTFVNAHPDGFDLQVGEKGCYLSGGQRQVITIARSLLLDPPILVLDEPSNSLDDNTEALLRSRLATYAVNKTLILITHKASMLSLVNRIIVLESGRIVADGPKDDVLKALAEGKVKVKPS